MIDFPTSPVVGDVYSFSGRNWEWDGSGWKRQINAGQQVSVFMLVSGLVQVSVEALPQTISGDWYELNYV